MAASALKHDHDMIIKKTAERVPFQVPSKYPFNQNKSMLKT